MLARMTSTGDRPPNSGAVFTRETHVLRLSSLCGNSVAIAS
jgi:hypothetical protein